MNSFSACRAYIAKLPPAISGAGGHPATFRAACECVRFGLGDGDAMNVLREFNARCQPPWSEKDLVHKLADARRAAGEQVRSFRQPRPAVRVVWKIERKAAVQAPAEPVKMIPPSNRETVEPVATAEPAPSAEPLARRRVNPTIPTDQAAWLPVAKQILAGEFGGCDRSTRESLTIGLRSIRHPDCQRALERFNRNKTSRA